MARSLITMEIFIWKTLVNICGINYVKYIFCLYILEQKCKMWVSNNLTGFNQNNEAYFKNQENDNIKKHIKIIDINQEFKDTNVSAVENSDESFVQFEKTSSVSAIENFDENSVQFEGTSNVIEIKKLLSTKTKDKKKNTWSVAEIRALIGAMEARYEDMHHIHKRKNFWSIISEELGSQNIQVNEITLYN